MCTGCADIRAQRVVPRALIGNVYTGSTRAHASPLNIPMKNERSLMTCTYGWLRRALIRCIRVSFPEHVFLEIVKLSVGARERSRARAMTFDEAERFNALNTISNVEIYTLSKVKNKFIK